MREYATGGNTLIVGGSRSRSKPRRANWRKFPEGLVPDGIVGKPQPLNFAVFDNYIQEPAYLSGWS
jgi:hypothetical protein